MASEKRLIDVNVLKSNMCEYCNKYFSEEPCEPSECIFQQFVNEQTTIDAVEVVHGRWALREKAGVDYWCCSVCEKIRSEYYYEPEDNYCPNCGAKMDGDGNG